MTEPTAEQSRTRRNATILAAAPAVLAPLLAGTLIKLEVLPPLPGLTIFFVVWLLGAALLPLLKPRRAWLGLPYTFAVAVPVLLITLLVNFRAVKVEGDSMLPTLQPGDVLLIDLRAQPDQRYGIFVLEVEGEDHNPLIKRLVGLPGESIDVRYGRVFAGEREVYPRDGSAPDSWNESRPAYARFYSGPKQLGEGEYFFLGDNPPDSRDSRHFGAVESKSVKGRAVWSLRGSHGFGRLR